MALQSSKKGFLNASYVSSFTSPCFCCAWLDFWEIGGLKSWCEEYSKMWKAASGDLTSFWQSKWSVLSSPRSLRLLCKLQGHCDVHNRFRSWRSRLDTIAHLSRKPKDLLRLPVEKTRYIEYVANVWKGRPKPRETLCKAFLLKWEMHVFAWTVWDVTFVPFLEHLPMRDSHNQIELGKVDTCAF